MVAGGIADRGRTVRTELEPSRAIALGVTGGLAGGIAMGLLSILLSDVSGAGALLPLQLVAAAFYGVDALLGGSLITLLGAVLHLVSSAFWGAMFSLIFRREPKSGAIARAIEGLCFGAFLWLVMWELVLPSVDPVLRDRAALASGSFFALHLLYGLIVALARPRRDSRAARGRVRSHA
jgi:hypothetical protein